MGNTAVAAIVCYNNGENASRTLQLIPPAGERDYDVVVIDDGSTDDTPEYLARHPFPLVRHPSNLELGATIKSGMRFALEHGHEYFCILAGNAKDDPRRIARVHAPLPAGMTEFVLISRSAP